MRILLTGCMGQVGQELRERLLQLGKLYASDYKTPVDDRQVFSLNLTNRGDLLRILDKIRPDVIVNTAAWTAVDAAEEQAEQAHVINVKVPQLMAEWAAANHALLVHYSTDYVFNGENTSPWLEDDAAQPLSEYGQTKLDGEKVIAASGCRYIILRTSWVYSSHSKNFVRTMLALAASRDSLQVVDDQRGCPTSATNIADVTVDILQQIQQGTAADISGIYHYTDDQSLVWYEFARDIFSRAEKTGLLDKSPTVSPVDSSAFQTPAKRPLYSVLNCQKIARVFGIKQKSFSMALDNCLAGILQQNTKISK